MIANSTAIRMKFQTSILHCLHIVRAERHLFEYLAAIKRQYSSQSSAKNSNIPNKFSTNAKKWIRTRLSTLSDFQPGTRNLRLGKETSKQIYDHISFTPQLQHIPFYTHQRTLAHPHTVPKGQVTIHKSALID